jgi:hypothetical protein
VALGLLYMGVKFNRLAPDKLVAVFNTVTGARVAPAGTVALKLVAVAEVTVARVAPKNTILPAMVELNPVPAITTESPAFALRGVKELMTGCDCATAVTQNSIIRREN